MLKVILNIDPNGLIYVLYQFKWLIIMNLAPTLVQIYEFYYQSIGQHILHTLFPLHYKDINQLYTIDEIRVKLKQ